MEGTPRLYNTLVQVLSQHRGSAIQVMLAGKRCFVTL
jgi:hypothetical protein